MLNINTIHSIFKIFLLITLCLSFYIFINNIGLKEFKNKSTFNTWQFPMLLAIFLDVWYEF